jgi:hypothetical protein
MLAYRYDTDTKEFIGTQYAQRNPLEGGYLLPANCTFTEPPDKVDGYVQIFDNGEWKQEIDHRDHYEVREEDFSFDIVKYIGQAKEGYIFVADDVYVNYLSDRDRYKIVNHEVIDIIDTEEYRKIKEDKEKERISHLKCTKRVLVLMLEEIGIDYYDNVLPLIEANRQAKLEWDLCVELERCNPLIDVIGRQLNISPAQIDILFRYANGELETINSEVSE